MFEVAVEFSFRATHAVREAGGRREKLHSHRWKTEVCVGSKRLSAAGFVMDFRVLKKLVSDVLKELEGTRLDRLRFFVENRLDPTTENIAFYIYRRLRGPVKKEKSRLCRVTVWETADSRASYAETVNGRD